MYTPPAPTSKASQDPVTFKLHLFPRILAGYFFKKLCNPQLSSRVPAMELLAMTNQESLEILIVFSFTVISRRIELHTLHFWELV